MSEPKKTESIRMRLTAEVKNALEQKAAERNLSVTEFLTRAGLGRATRQRADVDAINELRGCAEELKSIHTTLRGLPEGSSGLIDPAVMNAQMAAITATIERVWVNGGANDR
jgi:hypothetical protein